MAAATSNSDQEKANMLKTTLITALVSGTLIVINVKNFQLPITLRTNKKYFAGVFCKTKLQKRPIRQCKKSKTWQNGQFPLGNTLIPVTPVYVMNILKKNLVII